jgi:hypothetical protein
MAHLLYQVMLPDRNVEPQRNAENRGRTGATILPRHSLDYFKHFLSTLETYSTWGTFPTCPRRVSSY